MDYQATDVSFHIQLEAITRSSAYNAGMCLAEFGTRTNLDLNSLVIQHDFPGSVIEHEKDTTSSTMQSLLTCMVTPHETVEEIETEEQIMESLAAESRLTRTSIRGVSRRRNSFDYSSATTTNDKEGHESISHHAM